jgi:hypothetical protein
VKEKVEQTGKFADGNIAPQHDGFIAPLPIVSSAY